RYRLKYSRLRRAARALVFENGALCDEVARLEAKWLRAREERRFLLIRLLQLRAVVGPEKITTGEVINRRPRRVHSLGVGGVGPGAILPLGYRSTRFFASTRRPSRRCLYTCRIVTGPRCEIVAEEDHGK
ncbi:transforming growth factor beta regulator 1, partial [Antrostomus carolinensis]|uniref:transforming growth factor beta regulator 1 n=1 Tax=Antrostomus carolinensis TaxID=279965 RepID=UPI0010A98E56